MDVGTALITGLATGFAIAIQVGAVSLLLIEAAVASGTGAAVAAGMGVATVDLAFGAVAAATGGAAGAALSQHEGLIRIAAAAVLAAIALYGIAGVLRARRRSAGTGAIAPRPARGHYRRFVALTAANPLTIASFAAVAAASAPDGLAAAVAFVAGVGAGSAGWHLVLALAAGHARRWIVPGARDALAVGGRVAVLAIAAHLAMSA
jgi:threonine/homoserine/homoserine lactone efflux protein